MEYKLFIASFIISVFIGAPTLWAACHLYNRLAQHFGKPSIPVFLPSKAIGIAAAVFVLSIGIDFSVEWLSILADLTGTAGQLQRLILSVILCLLGETIMVGWALPTTQAKAIAVVLLQIAMEIIIVSVLMAAFSMISPLF